MAYAAHVSLAQTIDQTLKHVHFSVSFPDKQQIISLDKSVVFLLEFVENFPEKSSSLEGRIRDLANDTEDVIEYFLWEQIKSRKRWIDWTLGLSRVKFDHQLKKVMEKIDSIVGEAMDIKNSFKEEARVNDSSAFTSSSRFENIVVGSDDDLMAMKGRLCGESSKRQVIPVFGMGGIGKTTLARNVFDDPLIVEHFQIRVWVTVSQDYSAEGVLLGLVDSMKECEVERSGKSNEEIVYKSLKGRRYLIIMDDMWSKEAWDDVMNIFPDDNNGSRVVLTTRLLDVAAYPDSSSPVHEMQFMDDDQSWNLLLQKVFAEEDYHPELEDIGKEIARSCGGLPLAIVVIGGLLSAVSKTRACWKDNAENINSVAAKDGHLEKILSLSYTQLPHHLRPCFLYTGGFSRDAKIRVSELVKLWVAEGFLKRRNTSKSLEEEAEEYLEDLVKRSLVLVSERRPNGRIKTCSIHDLVRDLCVRKSHQEKFLLHVTDRYVIPRSIKYQRRLSIAHSDLNCITNIYGSSVRTIIGFQHKASLGSLENFRLLRVLHMVNSYYMSPSKASIRFSDELFELFHLRYLALYYYTEIPAAITNLQNLQTLIIQQPMKIVRKNEPATMFLTGEIWKMPRLRHIVSNDLGYLHNPEGAAFVLEHLQTLSVVRNLVCTKRIIKLIPNLKKLGVYYLPEEHDIDYQLHNLALLHQLEDLKLEFHFPFGEKLNPFGGELNPYFPRTLKKLTLTGWGFPWKEMTVVGSLPNLEVLKLRDESCRDEEWVTSEGEFRHLKHLVVEKCDLKYWASESSHFPSLKCLELRYCRQLSEIPDGFAEILTLELIEVKGNKSVMESAKRIQEEQRSWGNDALQVRCVDFSQ